MSKQAASLNPENFTEGGGLKDDFDATVTGACFALFDYNGKVDPPVPVIQLDTEDDEGEEYTENFSVGKPSDWTPSDDGTQLIAIGNATGINGTSKGGIFLKHLIEAGFPAEDLGDSIDSIVGLQAHFIRVPAPKRSGLKTERKFEETILVVSEITALPGEKKKPKGKPKSAGGTKTKTASKVKPKAKSSPKTKSGDDDVEEKTAEVIIEILSEDGMVAKKDLPAAIFKLRKDDPDRNAMVKVAFNEDFLSGREEWEYADGSLIAS